MPVMMQGDRFNALCRQAGDKAAERLLRELEYRSEVLGDWWVRDGMVHARLVDGTRLAYVELAWREWQP